MKLVNAIIAKLKSLCLSPSDPIMKIPSFNEVHQNDVRTLLLNQGEPEKGQIQPNKALICYNTTYLKKYSLF